MSSILHSNSRDEKKERKLDRGVTCKARRHSWTKTSCFWRLRLYSALGWKGVIVSLGKRIFVLSVSSVNIRWRKTSHRRVDDSLSAAFTALQDKDVGHRHLCGPMNCLPPQEGKEQTLEHIQVIIIEWKYRQPVKDKGKCLHAAHHGPTLQEQPPSELPSSPFITTPMSLRRNMSSAYLEILVRVTPGRPILRRAGLHAPPLSRRRRSSNFKA